jgi:hypothetical protein
MKKLLTILLLSAASCLSAAAQEFNPIPRAWKWIGDEESQCEASDVSEPLETNIDEEY